MRGPTDFLDDSNQQRFYTLERLHGIPEFVKGASVEEQRDVKELPSHVFADTQRRKFPCHTKAATWLAQAYFSLNQGFYSKKEAAFIQDRITKSAEYFNISALTDAFRKSYKKLAGHEIGEVKEADYGLVVTDDGTGNKMKLFPMPNAVSVKLAGEYLFANRFNYPYEWRRTAARNILKKAYDYDERWKKGEKVAGVDELGTLRFDADTREYLEKAAGFGASLPEFAAEKIAQRVVMIGPKHKDIRLKLASISKAVSEMPPERCTPAYLQKLATMLDQIDRETGICHDYHHGIDLPEEALFQLISKQAETVLSNHVTLTTGNTYPLQAFSHMPIDKVAAVMGEDFVSELMGADGMSVDLEKAAEVLPTLPRNDAVLLERVLSEAATAELDKSASLKHNPYSKEPGEDPFSKENMMRFFKDKGLKPRTMNYTIAVPANG